MDSAIRAVIVPDLRNRGFTGSYPHFRRRSADRIDLLTFQFLSTGGSFVVELGQCGPDGVTDWRHVPPDKVTAHDIFHRHRLGEITYRTDPWFVFGKRNYEEGHDHLEPESFYREIAERARGLLDAEAEPVWANWPRANWPKSKPK